MKSPPCEPERPGPEPPADLARALACWVTAAHARDNLEQAQRSLDEGRQILALLEQEKSAALLLASVAEQAAPESATAATPAQR